MRILQVVQKPQRRGAETFAYHLSQELRRGARHEVRIAYLYPFTGPGRLPLDNGDVCLSGSERHVLERSLGFHPRLLARLARVIRDFRPDIVQVNGARTVKYGALCRYLQPGSPWYLVYRNIGEPRQWIRGWHYRLFYRHVVMPRIHAAVGVTATTLAALLEFHGLDIPTAQIPRAIDPQALTPEQPPEEVRLALRTPSDAPVCIFVGSLGPEKRVDRLLRVIQEVATRIPEVHLWILGDGPLRRDLEGQARAMGSKARVTFLGALANVATYLNAADLHLLTSDTEGMPGVILEAGWLGLPTVATNVGGVSECMVEGETGTLVTPDDEGAFAAAVSHLLLDRSRRERMGQRAHEHIQRHYTIEQAGKRYEELYRGVRGR